jgi:hypothetical protein
MTIYLYKKTHNKTGLQYLGKTESSDPHQYRGFGTVWLRHINKHGYDVTTEILKECHSNEELKHWGLYYSTLWNIVEDRDSSGRKTWANLKPEEGVGGWGGKYNPTYDRIEKGTHNFVGGTNPIYSRLAAGTHNLQRRPDGTSHATDSVQAGTHNFLGGKIQQKSTLNRLRQGTHPSQIKKECEYCGKTVDSANYNRWHGYKCKFVNTKGSQS